VREEKIEQVERMADGRSATVVPPRIPQDPISSLITHFMKILRKISFIGMGLDHKWSDYGHGLWGITEVWDIHWVSPHTRLVTRKVYGVRETMGFRSHGL